MSSLKWHRAKGTGFCFLTGQRRQLATVLPSPDGTGYMYWAVGMDGDSPPCKTEDEAMDAAETLLGLRPAAQL